MQARVLYIFIIVMLCPASAQSQESREYAEKIPSFTYSIGLEPSVVRLKFPLELGIVRPDEVKYNYPGWLNPFLALNLNVADGIHTISQVTYTNITEPLVGASSFTKIWTFMGGIRLQDENSPFYLNILGGLNMHVYDIQTLSSTESFVSRSKSFVLGGNANLSLFSLPRGNFFISAGVKRAFHEDVGYFSYYARIGIEGILIRR